MEAYRSGRNELHSKCSCPKGHVGSNPTASAKLRLMKVRRSLFLSFSRHSQYSHRRLSGGNLGVEIQMHVDIGCRGKVAVTKAIPVLCF